MNDLEIFQNAPDHASPEELAAYLDEACAGDADLRARVEALFAADRETLQLVDHVPRAIKAASPTRGDTGRWEQAGESIGPYKLLQKIGEGGFGTVYMAEQLRPVKRRVALKIIKQGMDTRQVIARFEAERQALAMMEHQNIAKVLDAGATESGRPYFVMELVRGTPITTFCDEQELDTHQRLALFQDVCAAVGHAHQKGIIHRDLKPSNILVGLDGDTPIVKVIDFGVAKATQLQLTDKTLFTRFEQFIGTPLYISPEQASLSPIDIDTRSDIYSLGVLLYELLTGKPPIDKEELMKAGFDEMRRLIREQEAPKPSTRLSTATDAERRTIAKARHTEPRKLGLFIKGDLDWIVLKALEKDRKRRYDTAAALRRDIEHFLNDEVVSATPPSTAYRFQKFARRNKGALVGGSAVALALVAGTIVSTSQWFRAESEADKARTAQARAIQGEQDATESRDLAQKRLQTYARSDRMTATQLIEQGKEQDAMAYLARSSRNDPAATEALSTSWELLREWNYARRVVSFEQPLETVGPDQLVTVSPDGRRVAAYGERPAENTAKATSHQSIGRVWDVATGKVVATHVPDEGESVGAVTFDRAGNCLMLVWASADSEDHPARIWDIDAGRYRATLETEAGFTWPVAFSPDGTRVLVSLQEGSGTEKGGFGIWNTSTGRLVGPLNHEHKPDLARFTPDGSRVLSRTALSGEFFFWDGFTAELMESRGPSPDPPYRYAFDADGTRIASNGRIINVETETKVVQLQFYDEGRSIPSDVAPANNVVGIMVGRTVQFVPRNELFSPDGRYYAESRVREAFLWDTQTGLALMKMSANDEGKGHHDPQRDLQFSADGLLLMTKDGQIWSLHTWKRLTNYDGEPGIFSPDGRFIIARTGIWNWRPLRLAATDHPVPPMSGIPGWWADLLEVVSGRMLDETGALVRLSPTDWTTRKNRLQEILADDRSEAAVLAHWFLTPLGERPEHAEAADRLVSVEASSEDLWRAYLMDPDHPLLHLALALDTWNPFCGEFLADYSLQRLPDDPELKRRAARLQADLEISRALWAAFSGNWDEALSRLAALDIRPIPGRKKRTEGFLDRAKGLLLAHASAGDPASREAYQAHCLASLERAEGAGQSIQDMVVMSLIGTQPNGSPVLDTALRLARQAYEEKPKDLGASCLLGLAEYRMGNSAEAVQRFEKISSIRHEWRKAFYAMALHAEGEEEKAREVLVEVVEDLESDWEKERVVVFRRHGGWQRLLVWQLAVAEAKEVVGWVPEKLEDPLAPQAEPEETGESE